MRLIKMFGLAALAAVATTAFVGVTSASANTNTVLCTTHTALVCPEVDRVTSGKIHLTNVGVGELLSDLIDMLCLSFLAEALPLALGNPQLVHNDTLTFGGCGTTAAHDNCVVTVNEQSLFHLLKIGLAQGSLLGLNGKTRIVCEDVIFGIDIDCEYDSTGVLFKAESNGHLTATESKVDVVPGAEGFCPDESFLDFLMKMSVKKVVKELVWVEKEVSSSARVGQ